MSDSSTMRGIRTSTRSLMTARPHLPERASASAGDEPSFARATPALRQFNPSPFSSRLTLLSHLDCRRAGRRVLRQDHGPQPALADRLYLSQGHRLGLVLSLDRARRLLALHHRLEAVHDDE